AKVRRKSGQHDLSDAALPQVAGKAGRRPAVVLKERRVAVDGFAKTLADHKLGLGPREVLVKGCACRPLHTMVRPARLRAVRHLDRRERLAAGMARCEARMTR